MRLPPPEVLATWPKPNYVNPQTRGPALMIVELITLPIALLCLGLRLYVRIGIMRQTDWDDWLMVVAAVFSTGVTVSVILAFQLYGWDIHVWDLTLQKMVSGRQVSFAAQALFLGATAFAKCSILVSYLRLAPYKSWFRRLTFAAIWFVGITQGGYFIVLFTQCMPTSSYWHLEHQRTDCISESPALISQAVVTALSDFIVWVLPLPTLYQAKLPLTQRLALIVLFSFGSVVVIAGCIRTYWIHVVVNETYDVTWEGFQLWTWTAVEVQLGIICGCVPWLKSLFKFWKAGRTGHTAASRSTVVTGPGSGTKSEVRRTVTVTVCEEGAVMRMDSLGKASSPGEKYLDLESCRASIKSPEPEPEIVVGQAL